MIKWTDEAVEAASRVIINAIGDSDPLLDADVRAALDAAAKKQMLPTPEDFSSAINRAYRLGRIEALDKAADVVENMIYFGGVIERKRVERATIEDAAATIRALKDKKLNIMAWRGSKRNCNRRS